MIGLINGSPKAAESNSGVLIDLLRDMIGKDRETVIVPTYKWDKSAFETLEKCDTMIVVFPLYVDALPSHFLQFLMELEEYRKTVNSKKSYVYAVAQCGFHEGAQNQPALEIIKNFCKRAGLLWRGGIGVGGGGALDGAADSWLKPIAERLEELKQNILASEPYKGKKYVSIGMPRWIYKTAANFGWGVSAKKNGLRRKDLYRKLNE